jgi:hypothetical protein
MNASLPSTVTTYLVSVIAAPDPGLMARLTGIMARLDILPLQIYARLRQDVDGSIAQRDGAEAHLEIDLYLSADAADRRDRLIALLRAIVGVESVAASN